MSGANPTLKVLFLYPDPPGFSGQRRAAELMLEVLEESGTYRLLPVKLPGLPRTGGGVFAYLRFFGTTLLSLFAITKHALFGRLDGAFVALCQTRSTLIREHFLIRMIRLLSRKPDLPFGYRLDGSNFTAWSGDEAVARKFESVLSEGEIVSVLGPGQKEVIDERFGAADIEAMIVPNTCEFQSISADEVEKKHVADGSIHVLHLSSLMEPKGYIEVVHAMQQLDEELQVTICGKITSSPYDKTFNSVAAASKWLAEQVDCTPRLNWVHGAFGKEKHQLFLNSHIFVMPTDYPVEAQPLVLLEAMACGCAIVTTNVGEIPFMVDESCAIIINGRNADEVATAIEKLKSDAPFRQRLALAGRERFLERFSMQQNLSNWLSAFRVAYSPV